MAERFHLEQAHIAERYVLGELPPPEAEEFERHYFECEQCARAVENVQLFAANATAVFAEQPAPAPVTAPKKSSPGWLNLAWLKPAFAIPMAAALAVTILAVYQNTVTIPQLREARALPAFTLIGASRGEGAQVKVPAGTVSFALSADVPPDARLPKYLCVLSEAGHPVFQIEAPGPAEGQPITILVPVRSLQSGSHELSVYGVSQNDKIASYTFDFSIAQ
jgi:Putative zinc-finger